MNDAPQREEKIEVLYAVNVSRHIAEAGQANNSAEIPSADVAILLYGADMTTALE